MTADRARTPAAQGFRLPAEWEPHAATWLGWPANRTFDRIIVTAAVPDFPPPLVTQLAETGVMIAPLGVDAVQELTVVEKRLGKLIERQVSACRFVRLIGEHGFPG